MLDTYPRLVAFAELLGRAVPATNVGLDKVERFHLAGAVLDARSLATARAGGDRAAGVAELATNDRWFPRRQAFESLWVGGESLIYFAPNPGTNGVEAFGDYCLVIADDRVVNDYSGVFPCNSAKYYADDEGNVDARRAFEEVGSWASRADVAVVQLGPQANSLAETAWPDLLCGGLDHEEFMEVVTVGPVDLDRVVSLRISQVQKDEYDDLWWDYMDSKLVDPVEIRKAKAYDALMKWPNLQIDIV